jgi:hypothetical protein
MSTRSSNGTSGRPNKERLAKNAAGEISAADWQRKQYDAAMVKMQSLRALRLAKEAADKVASEADAASRPAAQGRVRLRKTTAAT